MGRVFGAQIQSLDSTRYRVGGCGTVFCTTYLLVIPLTVPRWRLWYRLRYRDDHRGTDRVTPMVDVAPCSVPRPHCGMGSVLCRGMAVRRDISCTRWSGRRTQPVGWSGRLPGAEPRKLSTYMSGGRVLGVK